MTINILDAQVGYAKQTAKGTPAANPTFVHGISGGAILTSEVSNEKSPATSGKRLATAARRTAVANGVEFDTPGYKASLAWLLYSALGSLVTTGEEAPYTHTMKPGDLFYWTAFRKFAGVVDKVQDVKTNEVKLAWDGPTPLEVSVNGPGTKWSPHATFVAGTDETGSDEEWTPVGGSMKLDIVGSDPVEADITKGEISIANGVEGTPIATGLESAIVAEAAMEAEASFTVIPEDLKLWNAALTGVAAGNGTQVADTLVTGSFEVVFKCGTDTLTITADKVPFICEHPEGSADGGSAELEVSGLILGEVNADAFKVVFVNGVASY